jgi:hypothetical protein
MTDFYDDVNRNPLVAMKKSEVETTVKGKGKVVPMLS